MVPGLCFARRVRGDRVDPFRFMSWVAVVIVLLWLLTELA